MSRKVKKSAERRAARKHTQGEMRVMWTKDFPFRRALSRENYLWRKNK